MQGDAPQISVKSIIDTYLCSLPPGEEPKFTVSVRDPQCFYPQGEDPEEAVNVFLGGARRRGVFHPSDLCKDRVCKRALAYELYAAPINPSKRRDGDDARMQRIFSNGHFVHARLQHILKQAAAKIGGEFHPEVGLPPNELRIAGTTDGGLILPISSAIHPRNAGKVVKWPYLLEIKSMRKADYDAIGLAPWPDHKAQVNIYMALSGVRAAVILVECKDNQALREFFVRFDEELWDRAKLTAANVLVYTSEGELPPPITKEQGCKLQECKFYDICKGNRSDWRPDGPLAPLPTTR